MLTLQPPEFALDLAAIKKALGPRTIAIVINSPHNPSGSFVISALHACVEFAALLKLKLHVNRSHVLCGRVEGPGCVVGRSAEEIRTIHFRRFR